MQLVDWYWPSGPIQNTVYGYSYQNGMPMNIDDTGFELGMPTPVEVLQQQLLLVQAEYENAMVALARARQDIRSLVDMHAQCMRDRQGAQRSLAQAQRELLDKRSLIYRLEVRVDEQETRIRLLEQQLHGVVRR